mgnify:CR=1 FL=1
MARLTKKQKEAHAKLDSTKSLDLNAASALIKEITNVKFDASVDIAVRLGVDPRKANQMVRGVVTLPHGTGKDVKVLALVTPDKEAEAQEAGADYVGLDEYLQKIKGGWTDVDVIITMPSVMGKLGPLGRVLGPRGLMPNPKTGTVTMDVAKAVKESGAAIFMEVWGCASGCDGNMVMVVFGHDNYGASAVDNSIEWEKVYNTYNKLNGEGSYDKDISNFGKSLEMYGRRTYTMTFMPELSSPEVMSIDKLYTN